MGQSDHRGSDVRLTTGELMKPSRVTRTSIDHRLWKWEAQLSFEWKNKNAHINELELRAALAEVRRRCRQRRHHNSRYLHLIDGQVSLGVLTRRRSSAHLLNRVNRKKLGA